MKRQNHNAYYHYLEPFLEKGDTQEIAVAKKQYFREYRARWRKEKRKKEKEIASSWTDEELRILTAEAKRHGMSRCRFIKKSTLAYIDKRYLVPDMIAVRSLLQVLAMEYNAIVELIEENGLNSKDGKDLLLKIDEQEKAIRVVLYSPKTIEQVITEAINKDPDAKTSIIMLLQAFTHDT